MGNIKETSKVFICESCKEYWVNPESKSCANCGSKSLAPTYGGNYMYARNFDFNNFKHFFNFPLKMCPGMDKVFTSTTSMAFDFELSFNGDPIISLSTKTKLKIVDVLNLESHVPTKDLNLIFEQDSATIKMDGKNFIIIRGWGSLTCENYEANCFNLKAEKAKEIQLKFATFIMERLSTKYKIQ